MKKSILIALLVLFFSCTIVACGKDDDSAPQSIDDGNPTLLLSGYQKIAVGQSSISYNGKTRPIKRQLVLPVEQFGEGVFAMFGLDTELEEFAAFSLDDDGEFSGNGLAFLEGVIYQGEGFSLHEIDDNRFRLTGILTNEQNGAELAIDLTVDLRSFGSGTSTFTIAGDTVILNGTLGSKTYNQLLDLNANHRNVHTILFQDIPGSENDEVNLAIGRLIRRAGYTTHATASSLIHSGGVDLFCAGKERTVEVGAEFEVHSWCCGDNGEEANEIPIGGPAHAIMIDYFNEMLGTLVGEDFYYFTINAAPFNELHVMTMEDIARYGLATE